MEATDRQKSYDKLGTIISTACLLHCLLTPLLVTFLPALAASVLGSEWLHIILAAMTVPIALIAFRRGYCCHGSSLPYVIGLPGLSALWLALLIGEPHWLETAFVGVGAILIVTAHIVNQRCTRGCRKTD